MKKSSMPPGQCLSPSGHSTIPLGSSVKPVDKKAGREGNTGRLRSSYELETPSGRKEACGPWRMCFPTLVAGG